MLRDTTRAALLALGLPFALGACSASTGAGDAVVRDQRPADLRVDDGARDQRHDDAGADADAGDATPSDGSAGGDRPASPMRCLSEPGPCSYAFAAGRLTANQPVQHDEQVQIGFFAFAPGETATACSFSGPKASKLYWHWSPGQRPVGTCPSDRVTPSRWDHATPDLVDGCPTAASWAPQSAVFKNCPPHLTAGFGRSASMITFTGNYEHDASAGTLTFRWLDTNGRCKKEYWNVKRVVRDGAATELVALELDGARTGDTTTRWKGTGNTHGYAYGSSQGTKAFVAQDTVAARYSSATPFATEEHALHSNQLSRAAGTQGAWVRCGGHPNVLFQYSCHKEDAGTTPDLVACNTKDASGKDSAGAYLKFIADAFASDTRYNVWYAFHAFLTQGSGCYHWGLHSMPLIQVIGASGTFRGWVGVEYQESEQGPAYHQYRVLRRVEAGYE